MGSMHIQADQRQQQTFSPRLQHAVRLLQLSSLDFAQAVHDALGRNPFLDVDDTDPHGTEVLEGDAAEALLPAGADADGAALNFDGTTPLAAETAGESDRDLWLGDAYGSGMRRGDGEDVSVLDRMAMESSLAEHLHAQLTGQAIGERDALLARIVVDSLDDDGYLRTPLSELAVLAEPGASDDEMALALQRVQALEPAGVGARDVAECLRLQLPLIPDADERALAERIIDEHLQRLAQRDISTMAHALGRSPREVEQVCDRIRRLAPRPGWGYGATDTQYVIPDVIVRKRRGAWTVTLNPAIVPKVKLNQVYADMFQRSRAKESSATGSAATEDNSEMANHLQEARWTLRNVEQRFSTILDVTEAIVKRQKHFLDFGPMAMKPLGLREIAEELGLHESTVSRVTNNKFMATPIGVFELKYFFSRAMSTAAGGECSGTAIRGLIQDMIAAEQPTDPLSDADIARQLARQGLTVARRTVTKYRQLLRIEPVDRRRRQA